MKMKKLLALFLAGSMLASLTGCGGGSTNNTASTDTSANSSKSDNNSTAGDTTALQGVTTISLYPADANLSSGVVSGHKGDYLAENGIELEVWAYSDEKTNAMLASGDLPDVMYVSKDNLDTMIEAGMLLNLEGYLDKLPSLMENEKLQVALNYVRKFRSAGTGELYCLPLTVGDNSTKVSWTDSTERNALKLNWEIYEEIGAPEINDIWDVIDVMDQMMEAHPTDDQGNPFYGTVLNNGSDSTYWACMTMFYRWMGYEEYQLPYLLESDMVNGTYSSILADDSMYHEGLKWYNEVYRRGLMDPDSINNDRATQKAKVDAGYAMVPSGYLPGWAPTCYEYLLPGTKVYYNYESTYGDANKVIAINANTENVDACLKLLDMWCNQDDVFRLLNGPEGDFWYKDGDNAYLTEDNLAYLEEHKGSETDRTLPSTGEPVALWNTSFCINTGEPTSYGDGKGGKRVQRTGSWEEVMAITSNNETFEKWKATTGYDTWKDWLAAEDAYVAVSDLARIQNFCSLPDDSMQLTIDALKTTIVEASWKMVYAESEEEFNSIWSKMVSDCEGLGAQSVIDWRLADIENARQIRDSLAE